MVMLLPKRRDCMIRVLTNADGDANPDLFQQMYRARAAIFAGRMGWKVTVTDGCEIDRYDIDHDPVYLVCLNETGRLTGSLRLLPTTGETMLCNEFADFFDEPVDVRSPTTWECTRFCVHPGTSSTAIERGRRVSRELLAGLCDLCLTSGIEQIVGLYDERMTRIYRRIGWSPIPLTSARCGHAQLTVGIWEVSADALASIQSSILRETNAGSGRRAA